MKLKGCRSAVVGLAVDGPACVCLCGCAYVYVFAVIRAAWCVCVCDCEWLNGLAEGVWLRAGRRGSRWTRFRATFGSRCDCVDLTPAPAREVVENANQTMTELPRKDAPRLGKSVSFDLIPYLLEI